MQAIPLGRVTVEAPGTLESLAAVLTASQRARVPTGRVRRIEVWPDVGAAGTVYVTCTVPGQAVANLAAFPKFTNTGSPWPWSIDTAGGNAVDLAQYSLDAEAAGDGAYVTFWVE
jgi:hypothetical protein